MRNIIRDAEFVEELDGGDVSDSSKVLSAKFILFNRIVWVLWSLDGMDHQITLIPGIPKGAFDIF